MFVWWHGGRPEFNLVHVASGLDLFQWKTLFEIFLPYLLHGLLDEKMVPMNQRDRNGNEVARSTRVDNPDKDMHYLLFVLLAARVRLLLGDVVAHSSVPRAHAIYTNYQIFFHRVFPDNWIPTHHWQFHVPGPSPLLAARARGQD